MNLSRSSYLTGKYEKVLSHPTSSNCDDSSLEYDDNEYSYEDQVLMVIDDARNLVYGYFLRFLLLIPCYFVFYYFFRAMVFINDVYYYDKEMPMFLDRIHEMIDNKHLAFLKKFSDYLLYPYIVITILRFLLFYPLVFNIQLYLRFSSIYIFGYLVRGLSVIFTTIPSSYPECKPFVIEETLWKTLQSFFFRDKSAIHCTGLLFSGHTYLVVLLYIIVAQNSDFIFNILMFIYASLITLSIVTTKFHYSVDAMFSLFFSYSFYHFYFTKIDSYGVKLINKMNNKYPNQNKMETTILEKRRINEWIAWIEQLKPLLSLGYKMKSLHKLVNENDLVDVKLLNKFNKVVYLFGLNKCDDLLTLYRGSESFNFSYWRKIK